MFDVMVIGAGPAGSHAAARLSAAGLSVALLEKDSEAGLNICCTGIIGAACLEQLSVPPELVYHQSRSATFVSPSGKRLRIARPETVAYVVDRPGLDRLLAERAADVGAQVFYNSRVTNISVDVEKGVDIRVEGPERPSGQTTMKARAVILATGFGSRLPGALGMGKVSDRVVAAQIPMKVGNLDEIEIYADDRLAPGGFAWIAPTSEGQGWAGLFARRDHGEAMKAFLTRLDRLGKGTPLSAGACFGAIPIQPLAQTVADRVMVVGEAAGQIKPTTGGGIYYATLCSEIAADVLARALDQGVPTAEALAPYESQWRARLGPEVAVGYAAHKLWRRVGNDEMELILSLAKRGGVSEMIRRSRRFSFDWHAPLLLQLAEMFPRRRFMDETRFSAATGG